MLKDDIMAVKKEINELKEQSFAMELLKDARKTNKRMFIIIIVILAMFTALLGYTLWLLNDIGTIESNEELTQEISDINTINNSSISNGGK